MAKARKKRGKNPNAKRNQTTRAGRRGYVDPGVARLRERRRQLTGSELLPDDPLGLLLGRRIIDTAAYNAGRDIGELLETVRMGLGNAGSVQGSWLAILSGGAIRATRRPDLSIDFALRRLARLRSVIGPDPHVVQAVFDICAGRWYPWLFDPEKFPQQLAIIRRALEKIARTWAPNPVVLTPGADRLTVHA